MKCNIPNRKSPSGTPEEEAAERQRIADSVAKIVKVMLRLLRPMIRDLPDPRDQRYTDYTKESLFLYGVMMFAMRASSRRDANQFMTEPFMQANLKAIVPGLDAVPHGDTLKDYLELIDAEVIQKIYLKLIKKLLRNQEFRRLAGKIRVLVDGSGKGSKDWEYSGKALHKNGGGGTVWMTYVLDAVLVLENGMVIPLYTEFLENGGAFDKQDCEIRAWHRMAPVLHGLVGDGATVILDGLYASGPVIMQCRKYMWDYVITLKDGSMPAFADEAHRLMEYEGANRAEADTGDGRHQEIAWANDVEHMISGNRTYIGLNVVRMVETWTEKHPVTGKPDETISTTYQFISSAPLSKKNAQKICMLGRSRWLVESCFNTEKNGGYGFEHTFSLDWCVNKAYHYFMKFGHFINVIIMSSEGLTDIVSSLGIGAFLKKVRLVFSGYVLDVASILAAAAQPYRMRLNPVSIYCRLASPP